MLADIFLNSSVVLRGVNIGDSNIKHVIGDYLMVSARVHALKRRLPTILTLAIYRIRDVTTCDMHKTYAQTHKEPGMTRFALFCLERPKSQPGSWLEPQLHLAVDGSHLQVAGLAQANMQNAL